MHYMYTNNTRLHELRRSFAKVLVRYNGPKKAVPSRLVASCVALRKLPIVRAELRAREACNFCDKFLLTLSVFTRLRGDVVYNWGAFAMATPTLDCVCRVQISAIGIVTNLKPCVPLESTMVVSKNRVVLETPTQLKD